MTTVKFARKEVLAGLKIMEHNVPRPAGNKVIAKVVDDKMKLFINNNISFGEGTFEVQASGNYLFGLNLKFFSEILAKMEGEKILLNISEKEVAISDGKSNFKLLVVNSQDLHVLEFKEDMKKFERTFTNEEFVNAFSKIGFCRANDESRPVFTGVTLQLDGKEIKLFTTDTHVLSKLSMADEQADFKAILPGSICEISPDDDVEMKVSTSMLQISFGNMRFTSMLLEGTTPDYERVIPEKDKCKKFTFNKNQFLATLERIMICSNVQNSSPVKATFGKNKLTLFADNVELGSVVEDVSLIEMDSSLEGQTIGFAGNYLKGVKTFDDINVNAYFTSPLHPVLFEGAQEDYKLIVTPVRIATANQ